MKKLFSALVSLLIASQLCIPVFAADVNPDNETHTVVEQEQQLEKEAQQTEKENSHIRNRVSIPNYSGYGSFSETKTFGQTLNSTNIITNQIVPIQFDNSYSYYYTFNVRQGYISFELEHDPVMNGLWNFSIYSGTDTNTYNSNTLVTGINNIPSALGGYKSPDVGVAAGTYTIKIYADSRMQKSLNTRIKINETNATNWETEPNNNPNKVENAAKLTFGKIMNGTMNLNGDGDWFRVDVKSQGVLRVSLNGDKIPGETWNYTLFDSKAAKSTNNIAIYQHNSFSGDKTTHVVPPTGLKKGTYYIRIHVPYSRNGNSFGAKYRLRADFDPTKTWEIEGSNDKVTGATNMTLNSARYGTFSGSHDKDWFKIRIPRAGSYTFNFTNTNGKDRNGSYFLGLYNNLNAAKKNTGRSIRFIQWKKVTKGNLTLNLKAGTYYIYMSGFQNSSKLAQYSLSVTNAGEEVKAITLSPAKTQPLKINKSKTIKIASVKPSNISKSNAYWSSSNTNVAVVNQKGKVTAVGKGSAVITCRIGGATKTIKFTVR